METVTVSLPSEGLCGVVRQAVTRFEKQTGLPVSLELPGDLEALPPAAGVQLLRILQEALANVRKHAGRPTHIDVCLRAEAGQFQMTIVDDGAGFEPAPGPALPVGARSRGDISRPPSSATLPVSQGMTGRVL